MWQEDGREQNAGDGPEAFTQEGAEKDKTTFYDGLRGTIGTIFANQLGGSFTHSEV